MDSTLGTRCQETTATGAKQGQVADIAGESFPPGNEGVRPTLLTKGTPPFLRMINLPQIGNGQQMYLPFRTNDMGPCYPNYQKRVPDALYWTKTREPEGIFKLLMFISGGFLTQILCVWLVPECLTKLEKRTVLVTKIPNSWGPKNKRLITISVEKTV